MSFSVKKILALVVAFTMLFAMSANVFATGTLGDMNNMIDSGATDKEDDAVTADQAVDGTGDVKIAKVVVSVPTTFSFKLNPYNIQKAGQVLSSKMQIVNKSECAMNLYITKCQATAAVSGALKIVDAKPAVDATDKEAFLFMRAAATPTGIATLDKTPFKAASETVAGDVMVETSASTEKKLVYAFDAATYAYSNGVATGTPTLGAKGTCYLGVVGATSANNTTTEWGENDKADIDITFKFVPQIIK